MAKVATIIRTSDGLAAINYSDGSVQIGTEDELRASLAMSHKGYEIAYSSTNKTATQNAEAHANKYGGYDKIGNYAQQRQEALANAQKSSSSNVSSSSSSSNYGGASAASLGSSNTYSKPSSANSYDILQYTVYGNLPDDPKRKADFQKFVAGKSKDQLNILIKENLNSSAQVRNAEEQKPDWIKNGTKPDMRQLTEFLSGRKIEDLYADPRGSSYWSQFTSQASNILYGSVGSNEDTRDWAAIGAASVNYYGYADTSKFTAATAKATSDMYGGTSVKQIPGSVSLGIYGGNGTLLRVLSGSEKAMANSLRDFGVSGTGWVAGAVQSQREGIQKLDNAISQQQEIVNNPNATAAARQQARDLIDNFAAAKQNALRFIENYAPKLQDEDFMKDYNPYGVYTNFFGKDESFISGVAPFVSSGFYSPFEGQTLSGVSTGTESQQVGTDQSGVVGQDGNQGVVSGDDQGQTGQDQDTGQQGTDQSGTFTGDSYSMPTGYTGSGFLPRFIGEQGLDMGDAGMVPMTGTFTKPATSSFVTSGTGQTYTLGGQDQGMAPPAPQQTQYEVKQYRNASGMTTNITFINGQPQTPIPSGFYPVETGMVSMAGQPTPATQPASGAPAVPNVQVPQAPFVPNVQPYSPSTSQQPYTPRFMNEGGVVTGSEMQSTTVDMSQYDPRSLAQQYIPQQGDYSGMDIVDVQADLAKTPGLPSGATVVPVGTQLEQGQLVSPYSGQVSGSVALPTALASTEQAMMPVSGGPALTSAVEASGAIGAALDQTQAQQLGEVSTIDAAQQGTSALSEMKAAQGTAIAMDNPVQRQLQDGELISGAANAATASAFAEQIEAATAEPSQKATVQGQLEGLMQQFEGGETPPWAAGAMRNAMSMLANRGLGASSLAGQAVIQAAMESALPIAQIDAQTQAQFEQQNLSNRQQRAILAAQQRATFIGQEFDQAFQARVANAAKVSDIANMNFTAEQQVALENSRIANTMNLANLNNSQAMVMAEAAALANLDIANLNNRQQAAVQNAQNFLQADLANLSNAQQTELFKAQQRVQSLFTDQAAINAAQQFNATSQNQVDQFYASLQSQTAQFNASQSNAQAQFNAGQVNVIERFNAEMNNQRDQFNAQNRLIIDQSNAQWRREIATADTAAVNRANEINAQSLLGYSQQAYNNLWQYYADNMEWAWTSAENERQRYMNLAITKMQGDTSMKLADAKADYESSAGFGQLIGKILTTDLSNTFLGDIFG